MGGKSHRLPRRRLPRRVLLDGWTRTKGTTCGQRGQPLTPPAVVAVVAMAVVVMVLAAVEVVAAAGRAVLDLDSLESDLQKIEATNPVGSVFITISTFVSLLIWLLASSKASQQQHRTQGLRFSAHRIFVRLLLKCDRDQASIKKSQLNDK